MLEILAILMGSLLMLLGLIGSVLPLLPGPPLCFIGLFLLALIKKFSPPLTPALIILLGIVTVLMIAMDYILPLLGAKKYGSSKWGVWGSILGMLIGMFLSPLAVLLGAFFGAVVAEWLAGKTKGESFRAGWGVMMGTLFATMVRLGFSGLMIYYFIMAI